MQRTQTACDTTPLLLRRLLILLRRRRRHCFGGHPSRACAWELARRTVNFCIGLRCLATKTRAPIVQRRLGSIGGSCSGGTPKTMSNQKSSGKNSNAFLWAPLEFALDARAKKANNKMRQNGCPAAIKVSIRFDLVKKFVSGQLVAGRQSCVVVVSAAANSNALLCYSNYNYFCLLLPLKVARSLWRSFHSRPRLCFMPAARFGWGDKKRAGCPTPRQPLAGAPERSARALL